MAPSNGTMVSRLLIPNMLNKPPAHPILTF